MQTTTLRVRVLTPQGFPAENANVTARLSGVGISQASGYIDRSYLSIDADQDGIAELILWPNSKGLTDAQYRITARGSDGSKLIDELVTIPESAIPVWLHDIVMVPPPTPKPYDEASIAIIQQARIDSSLSAAQALASEQSAEQSKSVAAGHSYDAGTASASAAQALIGASEAAQQAVSHAAEAKSAKTITVNAKDDALQAAVDALASGSTAQAAVQDALALLGGASAITQAVNAAEGSALAADQSRSTAEQYKEESLSSASSAQQAYLDAQAKATASANSANAASSSASTARLYMESSQDSAVEASLSAGQAAIDKQSAAGSALTAAQASTASLNRSAQLIAHAENMRAEINGHRVAAEQAASEAIDILGSAESIDEAVQISYANRAIVDVALTNNLIILSKVKP